MDHYEQFVTTAQEYSAWCRSPAAAPEQEAKRAQTLLLRLYALALELAPPENIDYDLDGERAADAEFQRVYKRAGALPFNNYAEILYPLEVPPGETCVGDLADDLADIYRDLSEGLSLHQTGHPREAAWTFVNAFRTHWGRHAASAIHALDEWIADNGSW